MKHDNYIVYSVTTNTRTGALVSVDFLNSFETPEQAKASLQYEADICRYENNEACTWLSDDTLKLPQGWNPEEETVLYIDQSTKFHDRNERPFHYGDNHQEQAIKEPASARFIFDHELLCNDDMKSINGYLWATSDLMKMLLVNAVEQERREGYIPGAVIDNPNFYANYDLSKGAVTLEGTYWTQEMEHGKVIEVHPYVNIPLTAEQEIEIRTLMENYCRDEYGVSCLEFINGHRTRNSMQPLPEDVSDRFPAMSHLKTFYLNNALYRGDSKIFLDENGQLYCHLNGEDTPRPLRDQIQDIKEGDAFFYGDSYFNIKTTSDNACQNTDESDHPWLVYGDDGDIYFEEDMGHYAAQQVKDFLLEKSNGIREQPSFDTLITFAQEKAAAAKATVISQNQEPSRV